MKKILIVVDMQKDFVDGVLGTKEASAIVSKVKAKIDTYRNAGDEVIFTKDTHFENYMDTAEGKKLPVPHCIRGTAGWEIVPALEPDGSRIIEKYSFGYTEWKNQLSLEAEDEVELIGVCTDICVVSNALILKALFPENEIRVDASCCAGVTPQAHEAALITMRSCQIDVR